MTRIALVVLAVSGLVLAQDQPATGGWRRAGDPPPANPSVNVPAPAPAAQDPEPVDRSDAYGQTVPAAPNGVYSGPADAAPQQPMPRQSTPQGARNAPAYGLPAAVTLKPGTYVTVRLGQLLTTDRNQPGDTFVAHLAQPLVVDGVVVAQRGQTVYGRVAEVQKQKADRPSQLGLQLTSLTLVDGNQVPVASQLVDRTGTSTPKGIQAGTVAATTGVGAAIGAAAGWGTGAAIGAGAGAIVGVAGVLLTRNHPTVVYPETPLTFAVTAPVTIATGNAPQAFRYVGPEDYNQPYNGQGQLGPRPSTGAYYTPNGGAPYGYPAYPYAYSPYAYGYGYPYYPYWGPGIGIGIYGGWGYGGWGYRGGGFRGGGFRGGFRR